MEVREREKASKPIRIYPSTHEVLKRVADENRTTIAEVVKRLSVLTQ